MSHVGDENRPALFPEMLYHVPMRLRSEIFVSALTRQVFNRGGYAAIEYKGAESAGAIYLRQRFRDGLESLYAPAPQTMFGEDEAETRLFECRFDRVEPAAIDDFIARERRFDPDLWLVELEIDEIGDLVSVVG